MNFSCYLVPKVRIRRLRRPMHDLNSLLLKPHLHTMGTVTSGTVLLENLTLGHTKAAALSLPNFFKYPTST